jgi:hypothetical protein
VFPFSSTKAVIATFLCLCISVSCLAQTKGFRAQYKGGTFNAKGDDGRLFVTSELITLEMKQGERLEISPKSVTTLSYGGEASRRVGLWVALGIVLSPVALFGLFAKRKNHYIGIEYKDAEGNAGAVMVRADKKEYMALIASLRSVTGKTVLGYQEKKDSDWTKMSDQK